MKYIVKPKRPLIGLLAKPILNEQRLDLTDAQVQRCINQNAIVYKENEDGTVSRVQDAHPGDVKVAEAITAAAANISTQNRIVSTVEDIRHPEYEQRPQQQQNNHQNDFKSKKQKERERQEALRKAAEEEAARKAAEESANGQTETAEPVDDENK